MQNNTFGAPNNTGGAGLGIRKQGTVATVNQFEIHDLSPSPATAAQAESFLAGLNPNGNGVDPISGGNFIASSAVTPPTG